MINFEYLIEVSCCMAIFWLTFHFLLSKTTFFKLNRGYLLVSLLFSCLIPLFSFQNQLIQENTFSAFLPEILVGSVQETANIFSQNNLLFLVYITGCLVVFSLLLVNLCKIYFLKSNPVSEQKNRISLYELPEIKHVFSFGNSIFYPKNWQISSTEKALILAHEQAHIQQKHSWDLLFISFMKIIFWFNPFVYLYEYSLQNIHEFLADEATTNQTNKFTYAQTILRCVQPHNGYKLFHNFSNKSQLKQRIMMLSKEKSQTYKLSHYFSFILIFCLLFGLFSCSNDDLDNGNTSITKTVDTHISNSTKTTGDIYQVVKEMPIFPGGDMELKQFLGSNVNYPESSKNANIEGLNLVSFVVEKNGSISNAKIIKSVDAAIDAESLRVVNSMPNWTAGKHNGNNVRVEYKLPIRYKLQ